MSAANMPFAEAILKSKNVCSAANMRPSITNIGEARVQSLRLVNLLHLVPDLFICVGSVLVDARRQVRDKKCCYCNLIKNLSSLRQTKVGVIFTPNPFPNFLLSLTPLVQISFSPQLSTVIKIEDGCQNFC